MRVFLLLKQYNFKPFTVTERQKILKIREETAVQIKKEDVKITVPVPKKEAPVLFSDLKQKIKYASASVGLIILFALL